MPTVDELMADLRRAKREIEALGPPPPTLIRVGSMERFQQDLEKRTGPLVERTPRTDPYPAYWAGVPVEETRLLPTNFAALYRGFEMVGLIDLDKETGDRTDETDI